MALKLAEVLDLAIGADVPSVNFLHLRNFLYTVIESLDIGDVTVKKAKRGVDISESKPEVSGSPSSDSEGEESGTHTGDGDQHLDSTDNENDHIPVAAKNGEVTTGLNGGEDENKDKKLENNSQRHGERGDLKDNEHLTEGRSSRIKSVKESGMRGRTKTRNESALSRVSNVSVSQNSVLSSRIHALEEGLKRLRDAFEDLVSRGDFGGNLSHDMHKARTISLERNDSSTQVRDGTRSNTTSALMNESGRCRQVVRESGGDAASQRPSSQPMPIAVVGGRDKTHQLTRSKTVDVLGGKKHLSRRVSVLEKLKQWRRDSSISEEAPGFESVASEGTKDGKDGKVEGKDTSVDYKVLNDKHRPSQDSSDESENDVSSEDEMEEVIENEIEAALNDPSDPEGPIFAVRLGLEQMQSWREKLLAAQEEFRSDIGAFKNSIQRMQADMQAFSSARKAQDAEGFNAIHHVHSLVLQLDGKQTKMTKTITELVDEFNRHERTFEDIFDAMGKLDEQKVDKVLLSTQVGVKANKDELRDKVSVSTFDETFSLLDRGLGDALDKMANQMSMEEALRETLNELQSEMELKLDRDEMDNLKDQLEARIKEVRSMQGKIVEGKPETQVDPAGFKRKTEKVHCLSCDRDVEIQSSQVQGQPSIPKAQRFGGSQAGKAETNVNKKASDDEYRYSKIKSEMVRGTGLLDFTEFPLSRRFCGGSHTIMRTNRRSLSSSHFNDYVVIRDETNSLVSLPTRDFIVSKESGMKRFMRQKLPAINELKRLPDIREGGNSSKSSCENEECLSEEEYKDKRVDKKSSMSSIIIGEIPVCKIDRE